MRLTDVIRLGINCRVHKDAEFDALGMATTLFTHQKVLSFLSDQKYLQDIIANENIVSIICTQEMLEQIDLPERIGVILSNDPKTDFFAIHNLLADRDFYWAKFFNEICDSACVSSNAIVADHSIRIGANSIIEPGVVIFPGSIIGNDVIIRSGTQVGTSGFQFVRTKTDVVAVKTGGRVVIKDGVEIQHNSCIDRGVLGGDTVIEKNVKIDNFVHIAHDDYIGEQTLITAGVQLGGRVIVGRNCWLGVNATVSNGITIGDNCRISLGSVVTKNVASNTTVTGNFAIDHDKFIQFIKSIR